VRKDRENSGKKAKKRKKMLDKAFSRWYKAAISGVRSSEAGGPITATDFQKLKGKGGGEKDLTGQGRAVGQKIHGGGGGETLRLAENRLVESTN